MQAKLVLSLLTLAHVATAGVSKTINELRQKVRTSSQHHARDVDSSLLYPVHTISIPIDHFHNESKYEPHTNGTFELRYWFDASHYKKGGPVIVLEGGETDATERLPYLQKGILAQLAQATNGIGVVLEHRYYGESFPTPDLSTENLRFLTTQQALADVAYFAQHIVFEGLEDQNLTAPNVPYIAYGGSYAGAFVAFLRVVYPDLFFGAISSSGVTEAIYDYWEYYEPIRQFGPPDCIRTTQTLTHLLDNLLQSSRNDSSLIAEYKSLFGLQNLTYNDDFANLLSTPLGDWQNRNWDPAVNDPTFFEYCGNITSNSTLYNTTVGETSQVKKLIAAGGYGQQVSQLTNRLLNYIGWFNETLIWPCLSGGQTADECFTTHNATFYEQDDISQQWRSWPYQFCTEYGYLQTGSGVPRNQLPLISRSIDLEYLSIICRDAFNITTPPDVEIVNQYGGFDIAYDRLAIIGGQADPWRPATPLADQAKPRPNTIDRPVIEMAGAVHHWDENGLFPNETTPNLPPKPVADTQKAEAAFVKAWLEEWK
ncbi:hypothetical protein VTN77DRAFT_3541 [Rasamsonia byssochlamydoides]|uniref:uncharacterized protein n=1 Tax=Rasamsonia byssochlamydoides TaxID=89139 RepID=UPI0037421CEE